MAVSRTFHHTMRPGRRVALLCAALLFVFMSNIPSKALTDEPFWTDPSTGFAIGGFDPVSYFTDADATPGETGKEYVWHGVAWLFDNDGNLDAFRRDPEVYAPQFGGHGAYGAVRGVWNQGNPRIWAVHHGRLYLFFSTINRDTWLRDPEAMIAEGTLHWEQKND